MIKETKESHQKCPILEEVEYLGKYILKHHLRANIRKFNDYTLFKHK